jgi:hypothetical protein
MNEDEISSNRYQVHSKEEEKAVLADMAGNHGVVLRQHKCGDPDCGVAFDLLIFQPDMEEHGGGIVAVSKIPQSAVLAIVQGMLAIFDRSMQQPGEE